VTTIPLGRRLPGASSNLPGRQIRTQIRDCSLRRPYSVLLPVGFAVPLPLPEARCALTAPFHPYRGIRNARGGLLSVALSLRPTPLARSNPAGRYPAPYIHGARTFLHGGLSALAAAAVRPTDTPLEVAINSGCVKAEP
jgi:hypothetical protein